MAIAQRLHLRLFLEGVEVPVVAAQVQMQKNAAAAASIQIVPNAEALELKPRTLVHLFFYDFYHGSPEEVIVGGEGITVSVAQRAVDPEAEGLFPPERFDSTEEQDQVDLENANYKLLFGGEVTGVAFSKSPSSRSVNLQCVDWSSYWDIAFQYQVSGMSLGRGGIRAAFTGASTNVFNSFLDGSADIVTQMISRAPRNYPSLAGTLLGGLVNIMEQIGGTYFGTRAIRGTNDFFSLAEMRLHLTQMIGANPYRQGDEVRLLRARGFGSLFRRSLSGLGKLVSIRQVLLALQPFIFHEIIPITSPRFIPSPVDRNATQFEPRRMDEDQGTRPLGRVASRVQADARELQERQQAALEEDPATTGNERGGVHAELAQLSRLCDRAASRARRLSVQEYVGLTPARQAFVSAASDFSLLQTLVLRPAGSTPDTAGLPRQASIAQQVLNVLDRIIASLETIINTTYQRRVRRRAHQPDPPDRLLSQIYRPDIWMVAPPRCNVIFPELYSSFSYSRSFNQEVSRMLLRTHSAFFGSDILFDGFYMAPSRLLGSRTGGRILRGRGGHERPATTGQAVWAVRDMMEHELFTGIIPAFQRMSDLNLHAIRGGSTEIDGERVGFAQLACNHIFFQNRFRSRQLQVSGKFNPFLAFGFPTLVVDRVDDLQGISNEEIAQQSQILTTALWEGEGADGNLALPPEEYERAVEAQSARVSDAVDQILAVRQNTHYLGTPASMSHSISASSGGITQVQMEYARTTNERTEFLGDNTVQPRRINRVRNIRTRTVVAALQEPSIGDVGPRGGEITAVTDVTESYERRQPRRTTNRTPTGERGRIGGEQLPLYIPNRRTRGRRRRGTRVPVGVRQPVAAYNSPEVTALVGVGGDFQTLDRSTGPTVEVEFRAFRVEEQVGVYRRVAVDLPPEDLTFPPWYGEHYKSVNVGGLYAYYFGVGSIADQTSFLAPSGRVLLSGSEEVGEREFRFQAAERTAITENSSSEVEPDPQIDANVRQDEQTGEPGDGQVFGQVNQRATIKDAVDELVRVYSLTKLNGFDVNEFIRAYTWRPVANAVDLLGTANLEINDRGEVLRGREGFHSRAFGDFDDLRQLVGPTDGSRPRTILGLRTTGEEDERTEREDAIAGRLDTRKEKRIQVLRYLNRLLNQAGVIG